MSNNQGLETILGKDRLITNQEVLAEFCTNASFLSGKNPQYVIKPQNTKEIEKLLKFANDKEISIVPCSSQAPHTRGGTSPLVDDSIIVDLSDMKNILRVDKRSKTAIVEAGVTFGELLEATHKEGLRVAMPLMPRQSKSVVGSILEREPTMMPKYHWDMQDPLCCVEVFFGTGDQFRTGSAAGPGSLEDQWASGQAQKSPMGPSQTDWAKIIQGSQGTMGIVTWASIKLELLPQIEKAFIAGSNDLNALVEFTYSLTKNRLADTCFILNTVDLAAIYNTPSIDDLPTWILLYSISGYKRLPEERVNYIEKDIADITTNLSISPQQTLNGISASKLLGRVNVPSEEPYWKIRNKGGYQDIFFLTTLDKAHTFIDAAKDEAKKNSVSMENIGIYIQPIQQGRNCHIEFTMMYDPSDPKEAEGVQKMFKNTSQTLMDMGGFFSRPYGIWSDMAYHKCPDTVNALKKVKGILDPKGIMNPGKLCF